MKLIYLIDEIIDENNYSENIIDALIDESDNVKTEKLTDLEKKELLYGYPDYFAYGALYDRCVYSFSFYSPTHNRRYAVVSDSFGNCIFEMDYN